ncbi:MAG: hypothetical protein Q9166_002815 [cf. Caloplaca sp. 2 TL-2023]
MVLAYGFLKLSITFFYRRLFFTARKTLFDWATKIAIAVVFLWTISFFLGFVFTCGLHPSAAWGSIEDRKDYCGAELDLNDAFVVSVVAAVVKVIVSFEITNPGLNVRVDPNLTVSTILFWSMIEAGLGIIAACLPTLQYLVRRASIDRFMNSVRSAFSPRSARLSKQPNSTPMGPYTNIHAGDSEAGSTAPITSMTKSSDL